MPHQLVAYSVLDQKPEMSTQKKARKSHSRTIKKAPIQQKHTCHFKTIPCQDKTFFPFRRTEMHRCRCIIIINDWLLELTVTIEITQPHPFTGKMKRPVPKAPNPTIREAEPPVLCPWYLFSGQMQILAAPTRNLIESNLKNLLYF